MAPSSARTTLPGVAANVSQWRGPAPPKAVALDLVGGGGGAEDETFGKVDAGQHMGIASRRSLATSGCGAGGLADDAVPPRAGAAAGPVSGWAMMSSSISAARRPASRTEERVAVKIGTSSPLLQIAEIVVMDDDRDIAPDDQPALFDGAAHADARDHRRGDDGRRRVGQGEHGLGGADSRRSRSSRSRP